MAEPLPLFPPSCPRPVQTADRFVHIRAKRFDAAQAAAAGEALLAGAAGNGNGGPAAPLAALRAAASPRKPNGDPRRYASTPSYEFEDATLDVRFTTLEQELGGRLAVATLLGAIPLPQRESRLLTLLADPANDAISLGRFCRQVHISLDRLFVLLREAALVRGQVRALVAVGTRLPEVAAGLMADAIPGERTCATCRGLGQFVDDPTPQTPAPVPRLCTACAGTGTVAYVPEVELRKIALQIGHLLEKSGGTTVNIAQKFGPGETYDQLTTRTDAMLYGTGRERTISPPLEGDVQEGTEGTEGTED